MYEEFFGLKSRPFDLVPNPEFFFESSSHRKALNYLKYGIFRGSGFIMLTGEVGTGKTTLIRDIMRDLGDRFLVSAVFYTCVQSVQLLQMINRDFGIESASKDKVDLISDLNDFLIEQCRLGKSPVVIVDEAQNLSRDNLEEIRLLSNLEGDREKLLQIILVGQPELRETLADPALRQLRQRISVQFHLSRLTEEETRAYVLHRLELAGNRNAVEFEDAAFETLFKVTQGTPRLINVCCDYILLTAFSENARTVTAELVSDVVEGLSLLPAPPPVKTDKPVSEHYAHFRKRLVLHEKCIVGIKRYFEGKLERMEVQMSKLEDSIPSAIEK